MPTKRLVQDLSRISQRDIIRKTVETYPNEWIVIHEALQNALDAIQRSGKKEGTVSISLDLDGREARISDNGIGFPYDLRLLGFGGSNKEANDWTMGGEMGIGLKVIIFSTDELELDATFIDPSTGKVRKWHAYAGGGHKYIDGLTDDIDLEFDEPVDSKSKETSTTVRYVFSDDRIVQVLEDIYDSYMATGIIHDHLAKTSLNKFKLGLEHYFRVVGYGANINNLLETNMTTPTKITLNIKCGGATVDRLSTGLKELFSQERDIGVEFTNRFWDVEEAVQRSQKGASKPTVLTTDFPNEEGNIGNYNANYVYVQKFTDWPSFSKLLSNSRMRNPPDKSSFEKIYDEYIAGAYLVVGARDILRKYLVGFPRMHLIAASGIPSTHDINPPRDVGELGFLNNIHFVVNLRTRLTYGKQTIKNPWLIGRINEFFRESFKATLRNAARSITGTIEPAPLPIVTPSAELVSRPSLDVPGLSIKKEPLEELEVIALFYELIGRGHLTAYETWGLTRSEMYDGKMLIQYPGITPGTPRSDNDLSTIEFKVWLSSLIDDLDQGRKRTEDMKLVILWEDDFAKVYPRGHSHFEVIDTKGTEIEDYSLPYVEKCLHDRRSAAKVQVLELKLVTDQLRNRRG